MPIILSPPHRDLTFMTPLSAARAETLVRFLSEDLHGTVLDIGCGWAELLLRVLVAAPGAHGVGVDLDAGSIEHGGHLARQRGLAERVRLVCGDARKEASGQLAAVICVGASQVWGPPVDDHQPLDYVAALSAVRALVPRGARVLYGEGIWSRPPTPEAAAPLSGRLDEFVPLVDLIDIAVAQGFRPLLIQEATTDEWDEFEAGYSACYARWSAGHERDHPDAAEVDAMADRQRTGYLRGYRGVLGMAYLGLVAV